MRLKIAALIIVFLVNTSVAAMLMRAAVAASNKLMKSQPMMQVPSFGLAFGITVFAHVDLAIVYLLLGQFGVSTQLLLIYLPFPLLVSVLSVMNRVFLTPSLARAVFVSVLQVVFAIAIAAAFAGIYQAFVR